MTVPGGLPNEYLTSTTSSFSEFLRTHNPDLLPSRNAAAMDTADHGHLAPHGTTIVAAAYADGVVLAGDRRATMGNVIAQRDIEKIFAADEFTGVGIAGSAGIAVDMVRLFQVELEHYEKIESTQLSIEGKANRLATLLRGNLGLAMQGLAAVPLMAGYDRAGKRGRIFSYDVTGGRYEEHAFHAIGSGGYFARGSLKKLHSAGQSRPEAIQVALQALYDAADDDSATGGPDLTRQIFPKIATITARGFAFVDQSEMEQQVTHMMDGRRERPDGPLASTGGA
ncbi:MAG: proteasome subunit beta [Actinomycetia bacterium]|nr:proteasome subunit beta [Actinomycetes bacterium]